MKNLTYLLIIFIILVANNFAIAANVSIDMSDAGEINKYFVVIGKVKKIDSGLEVRKTILTLHLLKIIKGNLTGSNEIQASVRVGKSSSVLNLPAIGDVVIAILNKDYSIPTSYINLLPNGAGMELITSIDDPKVKFVEQKILEFSN